MDDIINQIINDDFSMDELSRLACYVLAQIYRNLLSTEGFSDHVKLICELSDDPMFVDLLFVDYDRHWGTGILHLDTYHI